MWDVYTISITLLHALAAYSLWWHALWETTPLEYISESALSSVA